MRVGAVIVGHLRSRDDDLRGRHKDKEHDDDHNEGYCQNIPRTLWTVVAFSAVVFKLLPHFIRAIDLQTQTDIEPEEQD